MDDPVNHAVEEAVQVQEATSDGDLQTIRDVLSVHHVPVVASLHWDKLHSILHSLCDRIATQNLRSDFELKFLVDVGKLPTTAEGELSPSSKAKLEAAVAELQNRMQKKADAGDIDKISQSTQSVKDAFEKMESNIIELQSQFKRLSAGSRRASRISLNGGPGYQDNQFFLQETKATTIEELSPKLVDELTKDIKVAIEKNRKEITKEALRTNKFEPKESIKTILRLSQDISNLLSRIQELDTVVPALKDGLSLKANQLDLQRLARYMKEQLQRPENVLFTTKPLYGFKCMSCDHQVEKLSPVAGEHVPTNRMPPQILPMLSAERIFAFDRRSANGGNGFHMQSTTQPNKSWSASFSNAGSGVSRSQRGMPSRKASPRKSAIM